MIFINRITFLILRLTLAAGLLVGMSAYSLAIQLTGPQSTNAPTVQTAPTSAPSQPAVAAVSSSVYGPITKKDTLWRIAFTNRQDKTQSIDQVMIGIFMANPQAFLDNNINLLKDGSILTIPSAADIGAITKQQAKLKIASDSKSLPQALNNITKQATVVTSAVPAKIVTTERVRKVQPQPAVIPPKTPTAEPDVAMVENVKPNSPLDLEVSQVTNEQISAQNTTVLQGQLASKIELVNAKKQFNLAMNDMQLLIDENKVLREQLAELTESIEKMEVQDQLDKQLKKDHQLLKNELAMIEESVSLEQDSILNNGWFVAAVSSVPSIAILSGVMFWLSRKRKAVVEEQTVESAAPMPEGEPDLSMEEDLLDEDLNDDDLLISDDGDLLDDELSADADDALLDDALLDDDFSDELLVPDDDLDEIRLDEDSENDADQGVVSSDDIDALLAEANALEDSGDGDEGIVSADDIDALLAEADALEDSNDDIVSADDIDALLAEADALEDSGDGDEGIVSADDIDALLAEADALEDSNDDIIGADDIDALLAEADALPDTKDEAVDADDIDALLAEADTLPDTNDETVDADDIDALLAQADALPDIKDEAVDADDIDALLAEANDVVGDDDIDALLAETDSLADSLDDSLGDALDESNELDEDIATEVAVDDIDALLAETDSLADSLDDSLGDALDESNELDEDIAAEVAVDDIDALLAETDSLADSLDDSLGESSELDEDIAAEVAVDDIDALLAETDSLADPLDDSLDDSLDESSELDEDIATEVAADDIDTLLAQADSLPDVDSQEANPQQSLNDANALYNADIIDQPYLMTSEEQSSLMATGEAQHLVNALDQMIAKSPDHSREISHDNQDEISELDDILASVAGPQTEANSTTEANDSENLVEPAVETASHAKEQQLSSQLDKFEKENSYIDIDKLLDASASSENKIEPYHDVNLDTGLDEFPEVVSNINNIDVDIDPNDSSKKLDLARAYLEIDDQDSAREMLEKIELVGDEQQRKEAKKLLKKLAT